MTTTRLFLGAAILSTTLCSGIQASASPAQALKQFTAGPRLKFDSKKHEKAKGIQVTIEYPTSWKAEEGLRPNIVQKLIGKAEDGRSLQCILLIKKTPFLMRFVEGELFTPEFMRDMVKEMGGEYVKGDTTKIEGLHAGWTVFKQNAERTGMKLATYSLQYMVIYKHRWVQVQFMVGGLQGDSQTQRIFTSYLPLFQSMANTIIFPEKYK